MGNQTHYPLPTKFSKVDNGLLNQLSITHRGNWNGKSKNQPYSHSLSSVMGNGNDRPPNVAGQAAASRQPTAAYQPTASDVRAYCSERRSMLDIVNPRIEDSYQVRYLFVRPDVLE
jgi:hypothetical protein